MSSTAVVGAGLMAGNPLGLLLGIAAMAYFISTDRNSNDATIWGQSCVDSHVDLYAQEERRREAEDRAREEWRAEEKRQRLEEEERRRQGEDQRKRLAAQAWNEAEGTL